MAEAITGINKTMKALLIAALFSFQAAAQADIKFEKKTQKNEKVRAGEVLLFDFIYQNTGNQPLIITDVKVSCDCTTPTWPKSPLMPGNKDTIKVSVKTRNMIGYQDRTLEVISNAKGKTANIRFKVMIDHKNPLEN